MVKVVDTGGDGAIVLRGLRGRSPRLFGCGLAFLRKNRNEIAPRPAKAYMPGSGIGKIIEGIPTRSGVRFGSEAQGFWKGKLAPAGAPAAKAAAKEVADPVHASTLNHAVPEELAAAFSL